MNTPFDIVNEVFDFFIENYILFKMTCQLINLIDNVRMRILLASRNCATVVRDVRVTGTIGMLIKKSKD
jgi:hypothetical protein